MWIKLLIAIGDQPACSSHPKQRLGVDSILDVFVTYLWLNSVSVHCLNSFVLHKIFVTVKWNWPEEASNLRSLRKFCPRTHKSSLSRFVLIVLVEQFSKPPTPDQQELPAIPLPHQGGVLFNSHFREATGQVIYRKAPSNGKARGQRT